MKFPRISRPRAGGVGKPALSDDEIAVQLSEPLDHFIDHERVATDAVRAKVKELNDAISAAAKLNIRTEIETIEYVHLSKGACSFDCVTATISKVP